MNKHLTFVWLIYRKNFIISHSKCKSFSHLHTRALAGETEFQIGDVRRPITTWLTLSDSRLNYGPYGELMFSLSYLPTAERLTVVIVKARKLKLNDDDSNKMPQNVFVKVSVTNILYVYTRTSASPRANCTFIFKSKYE